MFPYDLQRYLNFVCTVRRCRTVRFPPKIRGNTEPASLQSTIVICRRARTVLKSISTVLILYRPVGLPMGMLVPLVLSGVSRRYAQRRAIVVRSFFAVTLFSPCKTMQCSQSAVLRNVQGAGICDNFQGGWSFPRRDVAAIRLSILYTTVLYMVIDPARRGVAGKRPCHRLEIPHDRC